MTEKVEIALTKEQCHQLKELFEKIVSSEYRDDPGMLIAQVFGYGDSGYMVARYVNHDMAIKLRGITGAKGTENGADYPREGKGLDEKPSKTNETTPRLND